MEKLGMHIERNATGADWPGYAGILYYDDPVSSDEAGGRERAETIRAIGNELANSKEDFAQLMTREVGKLIGDSRDEIDLCAQICQFTADNGPKALADEERDIPGGTGVVHYSPLGVIYGIQPWNFPCYQVVRYAIANLMAGNGVLLKHAENCTGSGLFLRDLMQRAGLPKNLFTVLLIDHDQSDLVIENDLVRGVTLTGSDGAGRIVARKAAENLKKSVLELGSNDAYIVLDDADIDNAVRLGLNYPHGPLAWGDALGSKRVLCILERIYALTGDPRYRPSLWLRRRATLGVSLLHVAPSGR